MNQKFVVAIGYSEGGLQPLLTFFDHVPHDQATYVILRHIPINQRGTLSEILERHSKLTIIEAKDGMAIENDKVYIPPSNSYVTIKNDTLYLRSRTQDSRGYNYTINTFLQSLAEEKAEKSIAVILSGSGFDGVAGVTRVHQARGLVIVQDPASCSYAEMAENAIKTNCVDKILPPEQMPHFIARHADTVLANENMVRRLR